VALIDPTRPIGDVALIDPTHPIGDVIQKILD
jgi:hypothetical protein